MYSTPLTEEDIFTMVMKCVRKQLGETAKLGASNKRSVIRSAAKCVIGKNISFNNKVADTAMHKNQTRRISCHTT